MTAVADPKTAPAAVSSGHLLLASTALGLLSALVAIGFAAYLPSSLYFDGPASDIPVIPDAAFTFVQRPVIAGALVTAAVSLLTGAAAWAWLRRNTRDRLMLWLLAGVAASANGIGALLLTARPFLSGTDAVEVVRSAMPHWPLLLASVLWLAQVLACMAAAIRVPKPETSRPSGRR